MVAIKNAVVPPSCYFCPMTNDGFYLCKANNPHKMLEDDCEERRPDWCPLVPVPPHYDLIDHNALKIAVMNGDCETRVDFLKHTLDCINKAPVVIPSDMPTYEAKGGET